MGHASSLADVIELRVDCLDSFRYSQLAQLIQAAHCPIILTFKSVTDARVLLAPELRKAEFIDVEFEFLQSLSDETRESLDWDRIICSFHDFEATDTRLDQQYERMASTRARVLKIAVHAQDVTDCLPVFRLMDRATTEGRELIAIAMGTRGIATRILGPSRGGFLAYSAVNEQSITAPGQPTVSELRDVYRLDRIDRQTKIYGVVGNPLSHSLSPVIHNAAFHAAGINAVYLPFEVGDVASFIRRMVDPPQREIDWPLNGLSITTPHKSAIIDELDWIEPSAKEIGAVNTITIEGDELRGYNTDASAFIQPLETRFSDLRNARCAVIGAGGAANAVTWSLKGHGADVTIFARQPQKAQALASRFAVNTASTDHANFKEFDIVINTTPLGTVGQSAHETPARAHQLRGARLAYDLVYNPVQTLFLSEAREAGCETVSGLEMFIAQAAAQFQLWTGLEAPKDVMRNAAERQLQSHKAE